MTHAAIGNTVVFIVVDNFSKDNESKKVIGKELAVHRLLYSSIINTKLSGRKKCATNTLMTMASFRYSCQIKPHHRESVEYL